jgi:hypothetical protein
VCFCLYVCGLVEESGRSVVMYTYTYVYMHGITRGTQRDEDYLLMAGGRQIIFPVQRKLYFYQLASIHTYTHTHIYDIHKLTAPASSPSWTTPARPSPKRKGNASKNDALLGCK